MEKLNFAQKTAQIAQRAYELNLKARKQGVTVLSNDIDAEGLKNQDIFEIGIKLAAEGADYKFISRILLNKINMEQDKLLKRIKTIQQTAVLCIHKNYNSWMLFNAVFSNISANEREETKKYLKDNIFTEYFRMYSGA